MNLAEIKTKTLEEQKKIMFNSTFNRVVMAHLTKNETNLFMYILKSMLTNEGEEMVFGLTELSDKLGVDFVNKIALELWHKIKGQDYPYYYAKNGKPVRTGGVLIFHSFFISTKRNELYIKTGTGIPGLFDKRGKESSEFELNEFLKSTKNKYAQLLYYRLSSVSETGRLSLSTEVIRKYMNCPDSYSTAMFNYRILNPAIQTLSLYFKELKLTTKSAEGKTIDRYIITYKRPSS